MLLEDGGPLLSVLIYVVLYILHNKNRFNNHDWIELKPTLKWSELL